MFSTGKIHCVTSFTAWSFLLTLFPESDSADEILQRARYHVSFATTTTTSDSLPHHTVFVCVCG